MRNIQIITVVVSLLLLTGIYFFADFKGNKNKKPAQADGHTDHADPMNPSADIETLDFNKYSIESENKLNAEKKKLVASLNEKATKSNTALTYKDVAEFWEKENNLNMAAFNYKKAAFLENTEKSITFAGNLYLALLQKSGEPGTRKWLALEAIECFSKASELNPNNTDTKIALATCYTEGTGETMKGVTLLREVTKTDSNNISANIILGKLAIQSGQFDKAIKRLELVLSLKPDNTEALYFLAEAYKGSGNKQKAISLFEQCKALVNNPEFTKEIDNYITTFK
ncbi:MAG: tetratricopeptide repeat protein [Bacteroidetes bacterium]|nr:tetratricopeptide repeat protein [Bacteroidota bacterium]